jgi:NADPH:quinone reductase-like Zn-dependent oxidoreductase
MKTADAPPVVPKATTPVLPKTMRACQGKDYGDIDEMLSVVEAATPKEGETGTGGVRVPSLSDLPPKQRKNMMLIKVLSVALAPGDVRVLSGKTRELQGPPSFPYIPGGDCCGIVLELPPVDDGKKSDLPPFQVGDRVAARFVGKPMGALSEYAIVNSRVADKVPAGISADGAAALASATPATIFAERVMKPEQDCRILILGAGGGMGSHVCQLIRRNHPDNNKDDLFIVGVSQSPQRLLESPLNCDQAIDYTKDNPFAMEQFQKDPFDCIVDFGSGGWLAMKEAANKGWPSIVKPASRGGRFLTTSLDTAWFECRTPWQMVKLYLVTTIWRAFISRTFARRRLPKYTFAFCLDDERSVMTNTMQYATTASEDAPDAGGKSRRVLVPVIHNNKPFPFTTEGVREAFRTVENHHPHGKVVIRVADE